MEISQKELIEKYGFTKGLIEKYLPKPKMKYNPYTHSKYKVWTDTQVNNALKNENLSKYIKRRSDKKARKEEKRKEENLSMSSFLEEFDIEAYVNKAKELNRHFTLHVGPTNSGKTYEALKALKYARTGLYLGPLRLLALEMFDKLNAEGYPTSLVTGEESIIKEDALYQASTIELCDYKKEYDLVIIDEAQLIADPFRGNNWTKAIYLVNAKEVHICLAPEALNLIKGMIESFDAEYEIVNHERLTPLEYTGNIKSIRQAKKGDCLVCFSRRQVLSTASELNRLGRKVSCIYGALPPESRREEVRKYTAGETEIMVSTDAIGMGVSLPIKRIIFMEIEKYDGVDTRELTTSEIKQIAGRAGRYGIYDKGEVLSLVNSPLIKRALEEETPFIDKISIPFPVDVIHSDYDLLKMLNIWQSLEKVEGFEREDMSDSIFLLEKIKKAKLTFDKERLYDLITTPVDIKSNELVEYFIYSLYFVEKDLIPPKPDFPLDTLEGCELQYKAYDIRHQILRRIDIIDDSTEDKAYISSRINKLLTKTKNTYYERYNHYR